MRGVIAAGGRDTAEAGAVALRAGGNAFDAAIAAAAMACVAEPVLASLGGGGFLMARRADGTTTLYDFFCQTPGSRRPVDEIDFRSIDVDFGSTTQEFHIGMGAVAAPGVPKGLTTVHGRECTLPLTELLAPAVEQAWDGVTATPFQALLLRVVRPIFTAEGATRAIYCREDGELVHGGDRFFTPGLADSLDLLAREGERPFVEGDIAAALLKLCRENGGHLTATDLQAYSVERRAPLRVDYRDVAVQINPPPSCGGILIGFALRLADELTLAPGMFGADTHLSGLCRIMGLTSKARVDSGLASQEPDAAARLLDPAFLSAYRHGVLGRPEALHGTTHISVIDETGNAAAVTLSNGAGCGMLIPGAGFMPNNMLGEEDLNPRGFHKWMPDVRVSSMMSPSLATWPDGRLVALGSGGSNRIRTAILQVLLNLVDFGMPLTQAMDAPRIHLEGMQLDVEPGYDAACQWRSKKGPPRRCKKGPLGGCGLVPVVHGRAPRATRRALNRLTRRRAREGPVGPRGQAWAGWSVQLAVGV